MMKIFWKIFFMDKEIILWEDFWKHFPKDLDE